MPSINVMMVSKTQIKIVQVTFLLYPELFIVLIFLLARYGSASANIEHLSNEHVNVFVIYFVILIRSH